MVLLLLAAASGLAGTTQAPGVAVVRATGWTPGGAVRDGAAEMLMLMQISRLRQEKGPAGLVAVGDRRGLFPAALEDALQAAVLHGVPVVKLAAGGRVLPAPHGLFIDAGRLSESDAAMVLARCVRRFGPLPDTDGAATEELREHVRRFQDEFTLAASPRLAGR